MIFKNKDKVPLVILGFLGTCIILGLVSLHGIGISPDSVYYLSVARHIADGTGFVGYDGYFLVLQPPLYPIILAAIKILMFIDPLFSSGYVNSILFGLIIYFSGLFLLKHLRSYILVILGTISILVSFVFIQLSLMALSEPLFILLILLYLYYFEKYQTDGNLSSLILLSSVTTLACLTRYIGIIIILTGIVSISLQENSSFKKKLNHIIIFMIISCMPIGLWIIRNIFLSGTLVGQRADSSYTLFENLRFLFNTILQWYLPMLVTTQKLIFACLIVLISSVVALIKRKEKIWMALKEIYPGLIFIMFYAGFIVISSTTTAYDHIADRLLSPIYIPVFFILFFLLDNVLNWLSHYLNKKLLLYIASAGIIIWMIYPVGKTVYIINDFNKFAGFGFNNRYWSNNETIKYIISNKELLNTYTFYSNVPEALYFLAGIRTRWSPARTLYNSPQLINAGHDIKTIWKQNDKVCIVWLDANNRQFLYSIEELRNSIKMTRIARFNDGAVYIIGN